MLPRNLKSAEEYKRCHLSQTEKCCFKALNLKLEMEPQVKIKRRKIQ